MPTADLVLYVDSQLTSPYTLSVFVALHEKHLPFEMRSIDLGSGEQRRPPFRDLSPTRRVPTLVHAGTPLAESSAITEYLDEVFPPPKHTALYPQTPLERAKARQVQAWLRSDLAPIRDERPTTVVFGQPISAPLSETAQAAAEKLFAAAARLLTARGGDLFDRWSIADTELALMLNRLVANGDQVPEQLAEYARRQWQRPSVKAWIEYREGVRRTA